VHSNDIQGYTGIHGNGYMIFEFNSISYNTLPQWKRTGIQSKRSRVQIPVRGPWEKVRERIGHSHRKLYRLGPCAINECKMYNWGQHVVETCVFIKETARETDWKPSGTMCAVDTIGDTTWGIHRIVRGTAWGGHIKWVSVPSGTGTTLVIIIMIIMIIIVITRE
jgi:hypothetical protein